MKLIKKLFYKISLFSYILTPEITYNCCPARRMSAEPWKTIVNLNHQNKRDREREKLKRNLMLNFFPFIVFFI
jgi:hypothetical protein